MEKPVVAADQGKKRRVPGYRLLLLHFTPEKGKNGSNPVESKQRFKKREWERFRFEAKRQCGK